MSLIPHDGEQKLTAQKTLLALKPKHALIAVHLVYADNFEEACQNAGLDTDYRAFVTPAEKESIETAAALCALDISGAALAYIQQANLLAATKLVDLLESEDPRVVRGAANDLLDRSLGKPKTQGAGDRQGPVNVKAYIVHEASPDIWSHSSEADDFIEGLFAADDDT